MSHELSIRENGFVEMAYLEKDGPCWHQLGNPLAEDASIEVWTQSAGFDWQINSAPVEYNGMVYKGQNVLYRKDTGAPLSVVSDKFKVVQPAEILEFFRDLISFDGMKLTTAGILYGGKQFWAMASTGREFDASNRDMVTGNILLTTGVDKTTSTKGLNTSIRTVCKNTLNFALQGAKTHYVRQTHRQEFDANLIKQQMGLYDAGWEQFRDKVQQLAKAKISSNTARQFMYELVKKPNVEDDQQPYTVAQMVDDLMNKFRNGIGNKGETFWDAVNAVTENVDYGYGKGRVADRKVAYSFFGNGANLKVEAFDKAVEMM